MVAFSESFLFNGDGRGDGAVFGSNCIHIGAEEPWNGNTHFSDPFMVLFLQLKKRFLKTHTHLHLENTLGEARSWCLVECSMIQDFLANIPLSTSPPFFFWG
eukprot:2693879-Amphidinium_carterae.1